MAGDMDSTEKDAVLLEAMRKEDSSWHPCQVSLCPEGAGLILDYEDCDSEVIIVNREEALACLRIRSIPLEGDDCSHIRQGERVLATQKSQPNSLFFDAKIEKILRVRHSKRVQCRCAYEIKWLCQDLKGGSLIVPSCSIMKLATKGIEVHPTVNIFLKSVKTSNCSDVSSLPPAAEDLDCQIYIHELLEKQIEEISSSVGASKGNTSENMLVGVAVDNQGLVQCGEIATSTAGRSSVQVPHKNPVKRSTRRQSKLQVELEVKELHPPVSSLQEEFMNSKSPLRPLAASAALASLMSKSFKNLEFPFNHEERDGFLCSSETPIQKPAAVEFLEGTGFCKVSVANCSFVADTLSVKSEPAAVTFVPKSSGSVKSLFSTSNDQIKPQLLNISSGSLTEESTIDSMATEFKVQTGSIRSSAPGRKTGQPTKITRVTRSAVQKIVGTSAGDFNRKACDDNIYTGSPSNRRKQPCQTFDEDGIKTLGTKSLIEENIRFSYTKSDSSAQNATLQESYTLRNKKKISSSVDTGIDLVPTRERKRLTRTESCNRKCKSQGMTYVQEREYINNMSMEAVITGEKEKVSMTEGEENYSENLQPDFSKGVVTSLHSNVLETEELVSPQFGAQIKSPPFEERDKRSNSISSEVLTKAADKSVSNVNNNQGAKKKTSNLRKQQLRSSPRLMSLSRTRSQNRA